LKSINWLQKDLGLKGSVLVAINEKTKTIYLLTQDVYNYIRSQYLKESKDLDFVLMFNSFFKKNSNLFHDFIKTLDINENFRTRIEYYENENKYTHIYLILEM
jgi:hypothetical protein